MESTDTGWDFLCARSWENIKVQVAVMDGSTGWGVGGLVPHKLFSL